MSQDITPQVESPPREPQKDHENQGNSSNSMSQTGSKSNVAASTRFNCPMICCISNRNVIGNKKKIPKNK
jgi:hypothetical protein